MLEKIMKSLMDTFSSAKDSMKAASSAELDQKEQIIQSMETKFEELNTEIHGLVRYRYIKSTWSYMTKRPLYHLLYSLPVEIRVQLFDKRMITLKVIVSNGHVVDLIDPFDKNEYESDIEQEPDETELNVFEELTKCNVEPIESVNENYKCETDEETAYKIALNYLTDNFTEINQLAQNALSIDDIKFIFHPDVPNEDIIFQSVAKILVERHGYKDACVTDDGNIIVTINLDLDEDDGNYDFEKKDNINNFCNNESPEKNESDLFSSSDEPIIISEDVLPDIIDEAIPEDLEDLLISNSNYTVIPKDNITADHNLEYIDL